MGYINCAGCGCEIYIPPELEAPDEEGILIASEPYYCDACERIAETATDEDRTEYCLHCGKALDDCSDIGCGYCDRRSPDWGLMQ